MIGTSVGIGLAFVAMLCWGFGDFMIQRSSRKMGDWETLFVITAFGSVVLLPFAFKDIVGLFSYQSAAAILVFCGLLYLVGALLDFESLKIGKITIVEPIWSFEIVVSAVLAFFIIGERLDAIQIGLIALLIIGLFLVSMRDYHFVKLHRLLLERGTLMAFAAALIMGVVNFLIAIGSRATDPIIVNFTINTIVAVSCGLYLWRHNKLKRLVADVKESPKTIIPMVISDNAAYVAFAFSLSLAPVGVAVALSESYIIVAVILGFIVGKERVLNHQKLGLAVAVFAAVILAAVTS